MIIDSGSSENIILKALVDMMGFSTKKTFSILQDKVDKVKDINITEVCCVPFSIGKIYKSDVVCSVVDMDACHLLLGRP